MGKISQMRRDAELFYKTRKPPRPKVIKIHFNKEGSKHNRPWTVHTDGRCIPASHLEFRCQSRAVESVFKPKKKTNPRAWLQVKGYVDVSIACPNRGDITVHIRDHSEPWDT